MSMRLREFFEPRFGVDLSQVRLHTDNAAARSAELLGADAYTIGNHIAFAAGQYRPDTTSGRLTLAHEIAHVTQQQSLATPWIMGQWRSTEPAGGCGICYVEVYEAMGEVALTALGAVGSAIHDAFTDHLERDLQGLPFEFDQPCGMAGTRPDICLVNSRRRRVFAGELKPSRQSGYEAGRQKLLAFEEGLPTGWTLQLLRAPEFSFNFRDPFALCTGSGIQRVTVHPMAPGLAGYYCEPPFSELRRTCTCSNRPPMYPRAVPYSETERAPRRPRVEPSAPRHDAPIGIPVLTRDVLEQIVNRGGELVTTLRAVIEGVLQGAQAAGAQRFAQILASVEAALDAAWSSLQHVLEESAEVIVIVCAAVALLAIIVLLAWLYWPAILAALGGIGSAVSSFGASLLTGSVGTSEAVQAGAVLLSIVAMIPASASASTPATTTTPPGPDSDLAEIARLLAQDVARGRPATPEERRASLIALRGRLDQLERNLGARRSTQQMAGVIPGLRAVVDQAIAGASP